MENELAPNLSKLVGRCALNLVGFLILINQTIRAQDSLLTKPLQKADSIYNYKYKSLDSLQKNFHLRTDSMQKAFAAPMNKLHASINKLNHKKDSLNNLHPPTQSL